MLTTADGLVGEITYNAGLLAPETLDDAARALGHYVDLLATAPGTRLSEVVGP
jgi:hypothetical protein